MHKNSQQIKQWRHHIIHVKICSFKFKILLIYTSNIVLEANSIVTG
jgi:hypothetical protein